MFFTLDGLTLPAAGQIMVTFDHISSRPADSAFTTRAEVTLYGDSVELERVVSYNPSATVTSSQLVFEGLLASGVQYYVAVRAASEFRSEAPVSGDSPQVSSGVSWTLSAEVVDVTNPVPVPEPPPLLLLAIGVLIIVVTARPLALKPSAGR
jgi:hypothetical protein